MDDEGGSLKTRATVGSTSGQQQQPSQQGRNGGGGSGVAGGGGGGLNMRMGHIYLVMEYVDHDLAGLIDAKIPLTPPRIKCFLKQILDGLNYMHERDIVHRCVHQRGVLFVLSWLQLMCFGHTHRGRKTKD
jgi:serine/threonine protein kinase